MAFVYSNWYIVMAVLVVAIIALVTIFIMMDKKDRVLIQKFISLLKGIFIIFNLFIIFLTSFKSLHVLKIIRINS